MRLNSTRLAAPMTLVSLAAAVACRDSARDVTSNDALRRDLDLATASAVSLASSARDLPPTRFVSALEAGERATAGAGAAAHPSRRSPTKAPRSHARHAPPAPAPVVAAAESHAAAEATTEAPAPAPTPTVAEDAGPARSENPTHGPSSDGVIGVSPTDGQGSDGPTIERRRGRGIGGIIGGVIGVVIRGGAIGDVDHCERDRPGSRGGLPFPIGGGAAGRMPVGFPSGGSILVPPSGVGRIPRRTM